MILINVDIYENLVGFDAKSYFLLPIFEFFENVICASNSVMVHADNRKKDILILDIILKVRLIDTSITAEAKHDFNTINFRNKICFRSTLKCESHFLVSLWCKNPLAQRKKP